MKILLIRFSAIGDVVLATPAIRMLRARHPTAQIDMVVKPELEDLIKTNPHLDTLFTLPHPFSWRELLALAKRLRAVRYDWVIDWQKHTKSYVLSWLVGGKIRRYPKYSVQRFFLVYFKKNYYRKVAPVPLRYLSALKSLGVEDDGRGAELFIPEEVEENLKRAWNLENGAYWVLAPGGGRATKRWPAAYFKRLADQMRKTLQINLVVIGGKDDVPLCRHILEGDSGRDQNLCGKTSLQETAAVLKNAIGLVTNDTGVMHMASAFSKPVVALFGPTVKEFGFFPFRTPHAVLEKDLECRPCSFHGTDNCPLEHFQCMRTILPEEVLNAVRTFHDRFFRR
ncbi:MAG: lipopolysaccharide heptosyltransferase II [Calditrichaeota bacterium]|nr:lipopolysaccharide heptosyltransferase II [Calditrichota bacterium]